MRKSSSRAAPVGIPVSTYRLQFNLHFIFRDAERIVAYLDDLGITDLYASPYLQARPGSLHGYDISDHSRLNPDLGEPEDHEALMRALRERRMGHMLDIVPNHMGIGEPSNLWWMDVLENGPSSPFAPFFDVDWKPLKTELTGRILLPVLGDQFGVILERGELRLFFEDGRFRVGYHEQIFPVAPRAASLVLRTVLKKMAERSSNDEEAQIELESVVTALEHLPPRDRTDPQSVAERRRESFVSRRRLMSLYEISEAFRATLAEAITDYNGEVGKPHSFDALERLLDDQAYRLAYWRVAAEEINYRRFFDINDLAGVRVERGEVFQATHELILRLLAEGKVTSLRIDHPDGLFDPHAYLDHLQHEAARHAGTGSVYTVVEKILTGDERLPVGWPVAGTVGYDFLNRANGLFVASEHAEEMSRVYERYIGARINFGTLAYEQKKLILRVALASELNVLAYHLNRISEKNRRFRDFTLGALTNALRETIASFPIYRTYIDAPAGQVGEADAANIERAVAAAIRRNRATSPTIFEFIRRILLLQWPDDLDEDAREEHALFVMKFQQLTGPVIAKGVEDTSFYVFNRLISLNEVGGEPDRFGTSPEGLHSWLADRSRTWPLAMNASTTHDTKRSEDVRARINVLSEMPAEWQERVRRWSEMNAPKKPVVDGDPVPDDNDEYLLYQTLVGSWPLDAANVAAPYRDRIKLYMEKAAREAKVHTSWINPNTAYEQAMHEFLDRVLDFEREGFRDGGFLADFASFHEGISDAGMVNGLAQLLLKLTVPGVSDTYQGQEIWDFSLVDPDNRRPVDYDRRAEMLARLRQRLTAGERTRLAAELLETWRDGRIKLFVTHLLLTLRKERRKLFLSGDYLPLATAGDRSEHLFAFARKSGRDTILVVAPRLPWTFRRASGSGVADHDAWGSTRVQTPPRSSGQRFRHLFTGAEIELPKNEWLPASEVLNGFPVVVLERI